MRAVPVNGPDGRALHAGTLCTGDRVQASRHHSRFYPATFVEDSPTDPARFVCLAFDADGGEVSTVPRWCLAVPSARPLKVAVVGAGPGGLALACSLARRGHAVDVLEALEAPEEVSRNGVLQ